MPNKSSLRVSNAPPKPLLIWDGECDFCRLWIERWREITEGKVDYATYQEAAVRFPEIPVDQFTRAMAFIKPDGDVFFAADAVYRSLAYRRSRRLLAWSYDRVPGFAAVSETGYGFIARHRNFASTVTRLLWGNDVRRPTYFWARRWFLRALGTIYLIAFVSLWVQVDGLIGSDGMSPANQFLPAVRAQIGPDAYSLLPTLCWFGQSDAFLYFLCGSGVLFSLLLIFGIAPAISLVALFALYLSLTIAGQIFFNFQWDVLLLEAGFLSIFFAPWRLWPRRFSVEAVVPAANNFHPAGDMPATALATPSRQHEPPVSRAGLFLLKLLLFKLMLMSGVVKPHRPRRSLLVATVADGVRLVGGQKSGMVQALFCSVLHRDRNCRAVFHLGAAPAATWCRWIDDLFASGNWAHRQLLLFQSSYNRALFAI